ncbi:DUF6461 domain-containing protein [Streptomyces sp. NPDC002690]
MWCLTITESVTPEEVLTRYGADARNARELTEQQAARLITSSSAAGTVLRVGSCGNWSFGYEAYGVVGIGTGTLSLLSQGTQSVAVLRGGDGMNRFEHWREGGPTEQFEPGFPSTKPPEPHPWWSEVQRRLDEVNGPHSGLAPVMETAFRHVRGVIDRDTLYGPLLTLWLDESSMAPPAFPPSPSGARQLGRALGPARPGGSPPTVGRALNMPIRRPQPSGEEIE